MNIKSITMFFVLILLSGCGKVGPLDLPRDKLDKSLISYPCDKLCKEKFEAEKKRQQSVIIQSN